MPTFSVLFVTTSAYRCNQLAKELRKHKSPELWLMVDHHDLTPESFLLKPITVVERLTVVRRALETAAGTVPFRIKELVEQVRHYLDQVRLPEPTGESLQHFENAIRGGQAISEQASRFPKSSFDFITSQLTQRARMFHAEAVRELAQELVVTAFRHELRNVSALLDELLKLSGQFVRNQDSIQSAIEAKRTRGLRDNVPMEASIIVQLPGPKEADVLAAMLERQRCGDRRTLAGLLLDKLEPRLREAALREFPSLADTATFGTFLAWLPAETIADAFADVFDQSIGEGHTLYELIHQFGVKLTARELWERAEPRMKSSGMPCRLMLILPSGHCQKGSASITAVKAMSRLRLAKFCVTP